MVGWELVCAVCSAGSLVGGIGRRGCAAGRSQGVRGVQRIMVSSAAAQRRAASGATGGGIAQGIEHVLAGLTRILWSFRVRVVTPNPTRSGFSSYGAIGITGTPPFNMTGPGLNQGFILEGQELGAAVAKQASLSSCGAGAGVGTGSAAPEVAAQQPGRAGWGYAT